MPVPAEITRLDQWVCAFAGGKCPMKAYEPGAASSSDPSTWCDYDTALESVNMGNYDDVGFVFNDNGIVGIDIDAGYDEDGLLSPLAARVLGLCHSYTERSRSGRGFHILLKGRLPFDGKNNRHGLEIYQKGRYFIMTGHSLLYPTDIVENQPAIDQILAEYFADADLRESVKPASGPVFTRVYNPVWSLPEAGKCRLRPHYPPVGPGSRNLSLTSLAGQLHTVGYDKAQIYAELLACNQTACAPPLDKREIKGIVNSVTRYKR